MKTASDNKVSPEYFGNDKEDMPQYAIDQEVRIVALIEKYNPTKEQQMKKRENTVESILYLGKKYIEKAKRVARERRKETGDDFSKEDAGRMMFDAYEEVEK